MRLASRICCFACRLLACLFFVAVDHSWAAAPVTAVTLTPDGKQAVIGSQAGIEVRSAPELVVARSLPTNLVNVHDLAFSPDGQTLLAAGGIPAEAGIVEVLHWPDGKRIREVKCHDDVVYRVTWSADGTHWASAGGDGKCQIVDARTGERRSRYIEHSRRVVSIVYLPDGKSIASAGGDETLRLWDSRTGASLRILDNHVAAVNAIAVRPVAHDSLPVLATLGEDRTVRLWQPTIGRLMRFAKLPSTPRCVAWSKNGDFLMVGCNDGRVRQLNFDALGVVKTHDGAIGRIHELLIESTTGGILIAGENGVQLIEGDQAE